MPTFPVYFIHMARTIKGTHHIVPNTSEIGISIQASCHINIKPAQIYKSTNWKLMGIARGTICRRCFRNV